MKVLCCFIQTGFFGECGCIQDEDYRADVLWVGE
jgi:hypothetical protein